MKSANNTKPKQEVQKHEDLKTIMMQVDITRIINNGKSNQ